MPQAQEVIRATNTYNCKNSRLMMVAAQNWFAYMASKATKFPSWNKKEMQVTFVDVLQ